MGVEHLDTRFKLVVAAGLAKIAIASDAIPVCPRLFASFFGCTHDASILIVERGKVQRQFDLAKGGAAGHLEHQVVDQFLQQILGVCQGPAIACTIGDLLMDLLDYQLVDVSAGPHLESFAVPARSDVTRCGHEYRAKAVESRVSWVGKRIVPMPNRCRFELVPFKGLRDEPGEVYVDVDIEDDNRRR